jgi:hypothetical protein
LDENDVIGFNLVGIFYADFNDFSSLRSIQVSWVGVVCGSGRGGKRWFRKGRNMWFKGG